jgi:hypothetical protein
MVPSIFIKENAVNVGGLEYITFAILLQSFAIRFTKEVHK